MRETQANCNITQRVCLKQVIVMMSNVNLIIFQLIFLDFNQRCNSTHECKQGSIQRKHLIPHWFQETLDL